MRDPREHAVAERDGIHGGIKANMKISGPPRAQWPKHEITRYYSQLWLKPCKHRTRGQAQGIPQALQAVYGF